MKVTGSAVVEQPRGAVVYTEGIERSAGQSEGSTRVGYKLGVPSAFVFFI